MQMASDKVWFIMSDFLHLAKILFFSITGDWTQGLSIKLYSQPFLKI